MATAACQRRCRRMGLMRSPRALVLGTIPHRATRPIVREYCNELAKYR